MPYPRYRVPHHASPQPRRANAPRAPEEAGSGAKNADDQSEYPPMHDTPDTALLIAVALAHDGGPSGARTLLRDTFPMLDVTERLQRALRSNTQGMLDALSPMLPASSRTLEQAEYISKLAATFKQAPADTSTPASKPSPKQENSQANPLNMLQMLSALSSMNGNSGSNSGSNMGNMGNMANIASMLGGMGNMGGNADSGGAQNPMAMMEMLSKMMGRNNNA